jgi:hypothetical protein
LQSTHLDDFSQHVLTFRHLLNNIIIHHSLESAPIDAYYANKAIWIKFTFLCDLDDKTANCPFVQINSSVVIAFFSIEKSDVKACNYWSYWLLLSFT